MESQPLRSTETLEVDAVKRIRPGLFGEQAQLRPGLGPDAAA